MDSVAMPLNHGIAVAHGHAMEERFSPQSPFGRSVFWLCLLAYGLHVIEE